MQVSLIGRAGGDDLGAESIIAPDSYYCYYYYCYWSITWALSDVVLAGVIAGRYCRLPESAAARLYPPGGAIQGRRYGGAQALYGCATPDKRRCHADALPSEDWKVIW